MPSEGLHSRHSGAYILQLPQQGLDTISDDYGLATTCRRMDRRMEIYKIHVPGSAALPGQAGEGPRATQCRGPCTAALVELRDWQAEMAAQAEVKHLMLMLRTVTWMVV